SEKQQKLKAELDRQLDEAKQAYAAKCEESANLQREWEQSLRQEVSWKPLRPTEVTSRDGAAFTVLYDGSVLVSGAHPDADTYTIRAESDLQQITAMRLEALPNKSSPHGGAGRADGGGFVLSKVQVFQEPIRPAENVRYVRIELPRHDWLTMA